jgi:hypothetical protein
MVRTLGPCLRDAGFAVLLLIVALGALIRNVLKPKRHRRA